MQTRSMDNLVRRWLVLGLALLLPVVAMPADAPNPDPWQPVRFLLGQWEGTSSGQPGEGRVQRTYEFALANRGSTASASSEYIQATGWSGAVRINSTVALTNP
jgi:hypothetical protein